MKMQKYKCKYRYSYKYRYKCKYKFKCEYKYKYKYKRDTNQVLIHRATNIRNFSIRSTVDRGK